MTLGASVVKETAVTIDSGKVLDEQGNNSRHSLWTRLGMIRLGMYGEIRETGNGRGFRSDDTDTIIT
jgi:hypothetical protein